MPCAEVGVALTTAIKAAIRADTVSIRMLRFITLTYNAHLHSLETTVTMTHKRRTVKQGSENNNEGHPLVTASIVCLGGSCEQGLYTYAMFWANLTARCYRGRVASIHSIAEKRNSRKPISSLMRTYAGLRTIMRI